MDSLVPPETCNSMAELRVQIDAIDVELITLLVTRSRYIDRAVDLKRIEGLPARIADRVEEVLDKVSATAIELELDPDLVHSLWTELIEWSIARETKELGA
ncbi:chorismate mutase [Sedimentitalea todarodis]|uniref:chorismate mutase n=1 Tax=Sedimentitalea todarodis TaxID=1631240 RepID=A0ABU3VGL4_9RHOB|nr:chorismate mutase [Sedimentitalea todarodis]MDU9005321.1 chorismate mutase [Sedimentitalea todarodis]